MVKKLNVNNMKHLYIILLCLPLIGFGQGWVQIFFGESSTRGLSVTQTDDQGYIITGQTISTIPQSSPGNIYVIKDGF